jgi:hypothetical protein
MPIYDLMIETKTQKNETDKSFRNGLCKMQNHIP